MSDLFYVIAQCAPYASYFHMFGQQIYLSSGSEHKCHIYLKICSMFEDKVKCTLELVS